MFDDASRGRDWIGLHAELSGCRLGLGFDCCLDYKFKIQFWIMMNTDISPPHSQKIPGTEHSCTGGLVLYLPGVLDGSTSKNVPK